MQKSKQINALALFIFILGSFLTASFLIDSGSVKDSEIDFIPTKQKAKQSGAGLAMDEMAFARCYPSKKLNNKAFKEAYQLKHIQSDLKDGPDASQWEAIGPKNIGGRSLCLGFNHQNENTIWLGSASGGLWRTHSQGVGVEAWHKVETGFPVLGVASIAVLPSDSNVIYIGTGEVYNIDNSAPGVADRTTRGSYGIGILKTVDGGETWESVLDWTYGEMTGIQDIAISPHNENVIFAATTEGLFRSNNGGLFWVEVNDIEMAVDVALHPTDSNIVLVSHGSLSDNLISGIYRSTNSGFSFEKVSTGLPDSYSGKARMNFSVSEPDIVYASIGNTFQSIGLFRSSDSGETWELKNSDDIAKYQGWYSHDVAVHPEAADEIIYVGVEAFKSINGGTSLVQEGYWSQWYFGEVPIGGPEGPSTYVHADIHAAYYHPMQNDMVCLATDGGLFVSLDRGENFEGRNGGLQCTQFYANFANSTTDSLLAIGGMQDNSTAIYRGTGAWARVIGGDGLSAGIDPQNDNIMYGSYQYLNLQKSTNGGDNFYGIAPPIDSDNVNFAGPFEIDPTNPEVLYAGTNFLYRSETRGDSWYRTSTESVSNNNPILTIALTDLDPGLIYVSTSALTVGEPQVLRSVDTGETWEIMEGLPDRMCMDIAVDPEEQNRVYAVFSGFESNHVFRSENGGDTWLESDFGLPDVPTNTIVIDSNHPNIIYIGNDLGVYVSQNYGDSWEVYSNGLPDAVMVMHLSISASNQKLRVATHGNGVYQTDLLEPSPEVGIDELDINLENVLVKLGQNFPNPVEGFTQIPVQLSQAAKIKISLCDLSGKKLLTLAEGRIESGLQQVKVDLSGLPSAYYIYNLEHDLEPQIKNNKTNFKHSKLLFKK